MKLRVLVDSTFFGRALALILLTVDLQADIYTVRREGANIVPDRSVDVSMDAETVVVEHGEEGFGVTATFVMRNQSDHDVNSLVAFPIIGSGYARSVELEREFLVEMRSGLDERVPFVPTKVQRQQGPKKAERTDYFADELPKKVGDYPEAIVWNVAWAARETKVIRVRFTMGEPMVLRGSNRLVSGWQLMYVVSTGSLWKGPIGRAEITFRMPKGHWLWSARAEAPRQWSYANHAKWCDENTVSWHFENWTPSDEIWLRSEEWAGLTADGAANYVFFLPPYEADKKAYSVELIDSLAERDLSLAKEYFPEKVKGFDVVLLKIVISDWLLHEVYARHGDPFYIGKESASLTFGDGRVGDGNGNIYSSWLVQFGKYGGLRGWYRPNRRLEGAVRTASLSPMERTNVEFLREYLRKSREQGPPSYRKIPVHDPGVN